MDHNADLRAKTIKYFDSINFSELNDQWIDQVVGNDFTDTEENKMTLNILFVNDGIITLNKLADICYAWCEKTTEKSTVPDSNISVEEEVLWTVLDEMGVTVKHILGFIYLLCSRASKRSSSSEEKTFGLASAKFYFNCLRVPGSTAYSVYHSNLFCLCVDCLSVPDFTVERDNATMRELEKRSGLFVSTLISFIPLLKDFYLGNDSNIIEHIVKKLVELAGCEIHNRINFNMNYLELGERELRRRFKISFIISSLAYQAFMALLEEDLNGDKNRNYNIVLFYLSQHILCSRAKKSQAISQKHLLVKDNAVSFICHNLRTKDFSSEVIQTALKRLCRGACDKVDFRTTISEAVVTVLLNMKSENIAEMIQWFLLLADSTDARDRAFALDIMNFLLNSTYGNDSDTVPDSLKPYLTQMPIIFSVLTRCDDFSPVVRRKALNVLSMNIECIFNFLDKTKDQEMFEFEEFEEVNEKDLDFNGNHRFFWYNLKSFKKRLNEIASILQRRVEDYNCINRVAALLALGNLVMFHIDFLTDENLKLFRQAMKDDNIIVRKQMIESLTGILVTYKDNSEVQECWLKCVLPLVQDPENSVYMKAVSVLEEQFLKKIYSSEQVEKECSFALLKRICTDLLAHQRYLQKAFSQWKADNKLKAQTLVQLEKCIETEWEESVWFFISNFAGYCSLPSRICNMTVEYLEKFHCRSCYRPAISHMLKVLTCALPNLPPEKLKIIQNVIRDSLELFSTPVQVIPEYIEILFKVHKLLQAETEFSEFSSDLFKKCEEQLLDIKLRSSFPTPPSEELLTKYFCIIKELCVVSSSFITQHIVSLLKTFSGCEKPSAALNKILTPVVRAHAYAALGKICLQDEILAKDLLTIYASELLSSKHDVIRNNVVIILLEMCKRYTSFADKYVPIISLCFKDKLYLIRYQTILLVVNLLQEGYIKWRGALFFCLVSTLVDKKEVIRELGHYSLSQLLQDKKKNLFSEHFVDSIFVFNGFPPPDNETVAQIVKELERFALKGEDKRAERLVLFSFLIESMEVKEKAYLVKSICEVLTNIAEAVYPLSEITECIVRDCFAILVSKELVTFDLGRFFDQVEKEDDEYAICETVSKTRRIVIVEPVLPVIVSLKNGITEPNSDLMNDIIIFLKELLMDYKDSLKELLAIDKILLKQLELEFRNDAERERTEKRLEKEAKDKQIVDKPMEKAGGFSDTIENIKSMIDDVSHLLSPQKNGKESSKEKSSVSSSEQTPKVAQNRATRQHTQMPDKNIIRPNTVNSGSQSITYNIASATPVEAMDIHRFASTPRVILTAVKVPPSTNVLNLSAIEKPNEPMVLGDSDEDI